MKGKIRCFLWMMLACCLWMTTLALADSQVKVSVFADSNRNGERGTYERGVSGVTLQLMADNVPIAVAETEAKGKVTFEQIAAGDYVLRVTLPQGNGFSKNRTGEKPSLDRNAMQPSNEQVQDYAFTADGTHAVLIGVGSTALSGVTGRVWMDDNDDGLMQADEPGFAGLAITLTNTKTEESVTVVSAEDGTYAALNLTPGNYDLTATLPDGLSYAKYVKKGGNYRSIFSSEGKATRTKNMKLSAGDINQNENIGVLPSAKVRGVCFLDANYNGYYDEGEELLSGVKIEVIRESKNTVSGKATTGADGAFCVENIRASLYRIRCILPEGTFFTKVTGDETGNRFKAVTGRREYSLQSVSLDVAEELVLYIGAVKPGSISGICYEDGNFSGKKDGKEKVVSGLTVQLLDENGLLVAEDKTNAKGKYVFEGLVPGHYTVSLMAKSGYAFTKLGEGNAIINQNGGKGASNLIYLALGEEKTGIDCGMILPGTVQGFVFGDANDNGLYDAGEQGLAGTQVKLVDENGDVFATTLTEDGVYCFDAVMPGRYRVVYVLPQDAVFAQAPACDRIELLADGTAQSLWFDFAMAQQVNMPTCGGMALSKISGVVFHDGNTNGVQEEGENPVFGATITLVPARADHEMAQVTTGADGHFALEGLRPDTYTMTIDFPDGQILSNGDELLLPFETGSWGHAKEISLQMGTVLAEQHLGTVQAASLQGRVWMDENNNGLMEAEEAGLAGKQVVVVRQETGMAFATLTTDENGLFATSDVALIPGTYHLEIALDASSIGSKTGDTQFTQADGKLVSQSLVVMEGQALNNVLAGVVCYTKVGGHVWLDRGQAMEAVQHAQVSLLDASGAVVNTLLSNEVGDYLFEGLLPGEYTLSVQLPSGQVVVEPDDHRLTEGGMNSVMVVCNGLKATSEPFMLQMAQHQLQMDIGSVLPARVGDLVWLDENRNGLQDSGEYGVPNVIVSLMRNGQEIASTVTDQYGFYYFADTYPAEYTLKVALPSEVTPTILRDDFVGITSILGAEGVSLPFEVQSGKRFYNADLGVQLVTDGVYPVHYGEGKTQDWTKLGTAN